MALSRSLTLILATGACALIATLAAAACLAQPAPKPLFPATAKLDLPPTPADGGRIAVTPGQLANPAIHSLLSVRHPMTYGEFVWNDQGVPQGPVWVQVDLSRQLISVFRSGHEIGAAVILYGANGKLTPTGDFPVLQKAADYRSKTYDAPMPYMMRLTADGVAIHASNVRQGWATHGCIGVPLEFARRMYGEMKVGDHVAISETPT